MKRRPFQLLFGDARNIASVGVALAAAWQARASAVFHSVWNLSGYWRE